MDDNTPSDKVQWEHNIDIPREALFYCDGCYNPMQLVKIEMMNEEKTRVRLTLKCRGYSRHCPLQYGYQYREMSVSNIL
jgi:hypothetical protein